MATLKHVNIWDGTVYRGTGSFSWQSDGITALNIAPDATEVEYSVIPGLVDTHVHLDAYAGPGERSWDSRWALSTPDVEKVFHAASHAQSAMRAGITTLRDLGGSPLQLAVGRAFNDGVIAGPRVLVGCPVGMTAGHGDLFTPPHYPHRAPVADSPDECRKLVRQWARQGADAIKIYVSGGVLSMGDKVGWRNHTLAEIRATIDEAHALGLPVAAHSHDAPSAQIALEEGVDSLEHGTGLNEELWETAVQKNLPVAPTLLINDRLADGTISVGTEAQEKARAVVEERDANFTGAAKAGVRFVLGTDANGVMVRFGDQWEEIQRMAETFAWSPERALRAATSDAAEAIGLGGAVGTLAPGMGADFLIIKGRPWEDITDLRQENLVAVVARGELVSGSLPG